MKHLGSILDPDATTALNHIYFKPFPPGPAVVSAAAPVTEIVTLYFPASITDEEKKDFEKKTEHVKEKFIQNPSQGGPSAMAMGWWREEVEKEGVEGKLAACSWAVGWESVEQHSAFREMDVFKEVMGPVRGSVKAAEVFHATLNQR